MFDLQKTQQLAQLFSVAPEARSESWVEQFRDVVLDASLCASESQIIQGPDGFPYFALYLPAPGEPFTSFCVSHILEYCTDNGYGIVIEPRGNPPGWVFSYGSLWALRARGEFLWEGPSGMQEDRLEAGEQREVTTGEPDEVLVPPWARAILRRYLQSCGIETPMFTCVLDPARTPEWNLVFNLNPAGFAEVDHFKGFMQRLSWFLPPYLPVLHISGSDGSDARFLI